MRVIPHAFSGQRGAVSVNLNICYVVFSLLALGGLSLPALASSFGWGRVNMEGAILDTACAIDTGSRYQSIDLSSFPLGQIVRDGKSAARPFSINLVHCVLQRSSSGQPDWQRFQVTFDGEGTEGVFQVYGEARGLGLQIADAQGNIASPGKPLPAENIVPGDMRLKYTLRLVGNRQVLRAGEYSSVVRFKMDYY